MAYPKIDQSLMTTAYNVTPCADRRANRTVKYVVVHYTGTTASARNNCLYFRGGNRNASADYFIDKDGSIFKYNGDCARFYSWHCGDGYGRNGIDNWNSIGIEVVSAGEDFTAKQRESLKALIDAICADYGVSKSNIKRHYDASGKSCPAAYAGNGNAKWSELLRYLQGGAAPSAPSTPASKPVASNGQPLYNVRVNGRWLDTMQGLVDTGGSGDDYAGIMGVGIQFLAIEGVGKYRVRSQSNGWLPYVSKRDLNDLDSGCAGDGSAIVAVEIPNSSIKYRVHVRGGGWLDWMVGTNDTGGSSDTFAGNGQPIDAIQIRKK